MWSWQTPGKKCKIDKNNKLLLENIIIHNKNYILLMINFFYFEKLLLNNHINVRRRFIKDNAWIKELIKT